MNNYQLKPKNWSQESYIKAYKFAAQAHQGQEMPGSKIPYIMHLSFVSMEVMAALNVETEYNGDLAIQCALLHDTIEDFRNWRPIGHCNNDSRY